MSYLKHTNSNMSKRMYYGGGTEPEPMPRPEMFPNPQMYQQALREYFSRNSMMSNGPDVNGSSFDEPKMSLQDLQQMNSVNKMGYKNDNWNTNSPDGNRVDIGLLGRLHNSNWGQGDMRRLEKGKMVSSMGDMSRPNAQEIDMTIDRTTNVQSDKVQPQSLLKSKTKAQSFNKAFAEARQAGKKTFKWNGNIYGTQLKGEGKSKEQQSIDTMQYDDVLTNNDNRQSPNGPNRQFAMGGVKPTKDSTDYYTDWYNSDYDMTNRSIGDMQSQYRLAMHNDIDNLSRQENKGKFGYDENGFKREKLPEINYSQSYLMLHPEFLYHPNKKAYGGNNRPRYWTGRTEPPYRSGNIMNPNEDSFFPQSINYLNMPDNNGMINKPLYDFQGQQNDFRNSVNGTNNYSTSYVDPGYPTVLTGKKPFTMLDNPPFEKDNINYNNPDIMTPEKPGTYSPTYSPFENVPKYTPDTTQPQGPSSFNGSDWVQGLSYLGQSAPAIYNAMMMNKPVEKEVYPLSNPYLVNNAEERRQINENADTANNVTIRNLKNENIGSYASNVGSALSGIQRNRGNQLGQSYQTQEQQNANIINQNRNTNNMIKMQEVIANAQNRALKQGFGAKLAEQIGMLAGQVGADMSKKKMDKYTLHMLQTGDYKFNDKGDIIDKENNVVMTEFELNGTKIKTTKHKKLFGGTRSKFV